MFQFQQMPSTNYNKSLMRTYLRKDKIDQLRNYIKLPRTVEIAKPIILLSLEQNPHLKAESPTEVLHNLIQWAQDYKRTTGKWMDLSGEPIPADFSMGDMPSDEFVRSRSSSSAASRSSTPPRKSSRRIAKGTELPAKPGRGEEPPAEDQLAEVQAKIEALKKKRDEQALNKALLTLRRMEEEEVAEDEAEGSE
jgi:hypothetical protein